METPNRPALVRDNLASLTPVRIKKLFGGEAFFHGERTLAVLGRDALVLRLPAPLRTDALSGGTAPPFLPERLAVGQGRVQIPCAEEPARLSHRARGAHAAAGRGRGPAKRRFRRAARRAAR